MAEIYKSKFPGQEIDERLELIPELQEGVEAAQQAADGKYTKPASGIPMTDLSDEVREAIEEGGGQADWAQTDTTAPDYIKNKPSIPTHVVRFVQQFLSDSERIQARANIGAGTYTKPSGGIPESDLADDVVPDVSDFITNTVNNLVNYYLKSETYSRSEVQQLIAAIQGVSFVSVASLPTPSADTMGGKIYLVPSTNPDEQNVKDEFITIQDGSTYAWEQIGSTKANLSGYVTLQQLNTALAAYTTTEALTTLLAAKQDTISDLSTIRSGAAAGATAYQKPQTGIPASDLAPGVIPTVPTDVVKYSSQSLSDAQKTQARTNIGAAAAAALTALETAIAAKYTKPSSGIPETDLDSAVQSALAKARSAVQDLSNYYTKTEIDALLSAVNSQQYVDVTALPTAGADTLGKIYLVGPDANNQYARYYTSYDGSAYSWVAAGTTEINLALYATKEELSQLSQEVVKYSAKAESTQDVNILDPNTLIISTKFLGRADGSLKNNGYGYTDFIEIPPEGLVINNAFPASGASGCCGVYYDEDKQYSGYSGYPGVVPSATHKYIRFNLGNPANFSEGENYAIYIGHHVPVYQPYSPVRTGRTSGAIIAENSIPITKLADVKSKNLVRKIYTGIYYNYGNNIYNNGNFDATPVMYVKPSTAYVLRANAKYIAIFNTDGTKSRQLTDASAFTTSASESMVIVSFYQTTAKEYQLEEGNTPTAYSPYAPQLDPAVVPYKEIPDGSVTRQKIAPGVSLQASPNKFNAFRVNGEILAGNKLTGVSVLFKTSQVLTVELFGVVEDVAIGAGDMVMYGAWLRVTPTSAQVIYGEGSTVFATYNHGLTLGSHTKIIFMMGESPTFRIINDSGASYSNTMRGFVGAPFVRNDGSLSITASLAYGSRMGDARIWVAGDSYWSPNDNARIPANLATMGVSNYLLLSRGGVSAQGLLPSIQALIEQGMRPSYIVWALGMNNGTDSNGEVNTNWLAAVTTFLALCDDAGITPVFCTIPTVPSFAHDALNTWIRESGYRYIDTAAEVEKEGTATWRGWGTADALLSSDQVHPTAAGALQLAGRILVDFPEIAQINP